MKCGVSTCHKEAALRVTYIHPSCGWDAIMCIRCAKEAYERRGIGEFVFADLPSASEAGTLVTTRQDAANSAANG